MKPAGVVVVGGGPAGLAAAVAAARVGAPVDLFDEHPVVGGQLRYRVSPLTEVVAPLSGASGLFPAALAEELATVAAADGVIVHPGTVVWGVFADNVLGVSDGTGTVRIQPERVIVATGSTDLPLPFAGATLPGVLTARAVQILIHVHRVRPGRRFVVLGGGPEAAEVAVDIARAGGTVVATFDPGDDPETVVATGDDGVTAVRLGHGAEAHTVEADVLVIAIGRQPDAALVLMAECAVGYEAMFGGFVPVRDETLHTTDRRILVAGDAAGVCAVDVALAEGWIAGLSAAADLGCAVGDQLTDALTAYRLLHPKRDEAVRRLARHHRPVERDEPR